MMCSWGETTQLCPVCIHATPLHATEASSSQPTSCQTNVIHTYTPQHITSELCLEWRIYKQWCRGFTWDGFEEEIMIKSIFIALPTPEDSTLYHFYMVRPLVGCNITSTQEGTSQHFTKHMQLKPAAKQCCSFST